MLTATNKHTEHLTTTNKHTYILTLTNQHTDRLIATTQHKEMLTTTNKHTHMLTLWLTDQTERGGQNSNFIFKDAKTNSILIRSALFVDSLSTDPIRILRQTSCFPAGRGFFLNFFLQLVMNVAVFLSNCRIFTLLFIKLFFVWMQAIHWNQQWTISCMYVPSQFM